MQLCDFLDLLGKETGLGPRELEILAGFPPAPVKLPSDPDSKLSSLAIANGDTLLVRRQEAPAGNQQESEAPHSADATASEATNGMEVSEGHPLHCQMHAGSPLLQAGKQPIQFSLTRGGTCLQVSQCFFDCMLIHALLYQMHPQLMRRLQAVDLFMAERVLSQLCFGAQMDEDEQLARAIAASLGHEDGRGQSSPAAEPVSAAPARSVPSQRLEAARAPQTEQRDAQSSSSKQPQQGGSPPSPSRRSCIVS